MVAALGFCRSVNRILAESHDSKRSGVAVSQPCRRQASQEKRHNRLALCQYTVMHWVEVFGYDSNPWVAALKLSWSPLLDVT